MIGRVKKKQTINRANLISAIFYRSFSMYFELDGGDFFGEDTFDCR